MPVHLHMQNHLCLYARGTELAVNNWSFRPRAATAVDERQADAKEASAS